MTATIVVFRLPSDKPAATVRTDSRGGFRHHLPPGTYQVEGRISDQLLWSRAVTVHVRSNQVSRVTIIFIPRHPLPVTTGAASG